MPKHARDLPLPALAIDPAASQPLHRQIYFAIREAILEGRLKPGARLPATRALAIDLGVSRNTVMTAFEQLRAEGYVDGKVGAGSFIPRDLPEETPRPGARRTDPAPARQQPRAISARGAMLVGLKHRGARARPFSPGLPELEQFPFRDWARLLARRWRRPQRAFLVGGEPGGYRPLCEAIAEYLAMARAVFCRADQVIITSGAQQALDLVARVLIDPGDPVWMEEPGYPPTSAVLRAAGARVVPVPVDDEGLSVTAGQRLEPAPRLICVSPSHQYPLGITMSLGRRLELLERARAIDGMVIEDDYDSEYRYAGRPLAAMQGLDGDGRVIYLGTMSKVMFPGLRIGYMVVPDHLVDAFLAVRAMVDAHPSSIAQAALADFITEGFLGAHIRRMRLLYAERQTALLSAFARRFGDRLVLAPAAAGMHLVGRLAPETDDRTIAERAAAAGVEAPALSHYYQGPARLSGLLLGYAGVEPHAIERAADRLADVFQPSSGQGTP
jgi:GntR family transcriptional regulator/MocR family aminotransferase